MAFDGHQRTFANSLFPTYQNQVSLNSHDGIFVSEIGNSR